MKKIFKKIQNFAKKCWQTIKKFAKKAVQMIEKAAQWCMDHQEIVMGASLAVEGGAWLVRKLKKSNTQKEIDFQRTHIYDHSIGHHISLRREPTSNEMLEFSRRKESGEKPIDILSSMHLLA